ncbi:MAG: alpha/beta fold hydrolase [Pseudomonadota bacterium]|nr:alpha/beta fold hydrolase [Pseudomonadota bacterium]
MRAAHARPSVLLLHGLWMHAPTMRWFATRLERDGFDAKPLGYYSLLDDTEHTVGTIAEALAAAPGRHVVAHSLGGLLALRAAMQISEVPVGRIVCLGTPLAGSRAAGGICEKIPAGDKLIGQHLQLLLAGAGPLPAGVEVGMIAGSLPVGLGGLLARFEGEHDGSVAIEETRLAGLADHIVLRASHSGLIFSNAAAAQAACFLREGQFQHRESGGVAAIA